MTMQRVENAADLAQSALGLTTAALKSPHRAWAGSLTIGREILASVAGRATTAPAKGDKRFRDPVWGSNPAYRALVGNRANRGVSAVVAAHAGHHAVQCRQQSRVARASRGFPHRVATSAGGIEWWATTAGLRR